MNSILNLTHTVKETMNERVGSVWSSFQKMLHMSSLIQSCRGAQGGGSPGEYVV